MHTPSSISALFLKLNDMIGRLVSGLTIVMAWIMFLIVVLRYGFNIGWTSLQESVTYLHACVFLLGAAYTLQKDGHVRVDVFYRNYTEEKKAFVNCLGTLVFLLPTSFFILFVSWDYVMDSWSIKEASMESGGLPFVYLLKSLLLIFSISLVLQGVADFFHYLKAFISHRQKGSFD